MRLRMKLSSKAITVIAVSAAAVLFFGAAAMVFLRISPVSILLFLLFQILAVVLPGLAIVKLTSVELTPLETAVTCYGTGMLCDIAVYFILSPLNLGKFIPVGILFLALISAAVLYKLRFQKVCVKPDAGELITGMVFAAVAAALTFVMLSASNLTPDISGARGYYHDLTNGVSLIASAFNRFPMEFLQMSGTPHFYHPFYYAYCAVMERCLGFSAFDIGTKFSLITIAPFFFLAFICTARMVLDKLRYVIISAVSVLLFFSQLTHYIYVDVLGFPLGLAFSCCAVLFFLKAEGTDSRRFNRYHVLSSLFVIGCLGAKGPNGVTIVFSICFALLLSLTRERKPCRVISAGLLYAAGFFVSYFLLYRQGAESMLMRGTDLAAERLSYFTKMPETWPSWLRIFLADVFYSAGTNKLLTLCFVFSVICLIIAREKSDEVIDMACGGTLCGLVLSNVFMQFGSSEIYFLYAIIPVAVVAGIYSVKTILFRLKPRLRAIVAGLIVIFLLPIFITETMNTSKTISAGFKQAITYSPMRKDLAFSDNMLPLPGTSARGNALTPKEYEGLLWLRDNTERDSVIASGRYLTHNKYFYGTAFTERRFYLEGWGYVTMEDSNANTPEKVKRDSVMSLFYAAEDEGFVPLLQSYAIDYVIIFEYQNPGWRFTNEFGTKTVFENEHIAVYDIRPQT